MLNPNQLIVLLKLHRGLNRGEDLQIEATRGNYDDDILKSVVLLPGTIQRVLTDRGLKYVEIACHNIAPNTGY